MERNYAITHAMHLNKRLSLRHASYIMAAGWLFALIMAFLPLVGVSDYRKFAVCLPFEVGNSVSKGYVVFLMVINGVAFLILMGCYLKAHEKLTKKRMNETTETNFFPILIGFRCTVLFEDRRRGILTTRGLPKGWPYLCLPTFYVGHRLRFFRWRRHPVYDSFRSRKPKSLPSSSCPSIPAAILSSTPYWRNSSKRTASSFVKRLKSRAWPAALAVVGTVRTSATAKRLAIPTAWAIAIPDRKMAAHVSVKAGVCWRKIRFPIHRILTVITVTIVPPDWVGFVHHFARSSAASERLNANWVNRLLRLTSTPIRSRKFNRSNCIAISIGVRNPCQVTPTAHHDLIRLKRLVVDYRCGWSGGVGTPGLSPGNLLRIRIFLLLEMILPLQLWPLRQALEQRHGGILDPPSPAMEVLLIKVCLL